MIEKLYTPEEVAEALKVSVRTAYKIMHQMPHMMRPFRVAESALWAWMRGNTQDPAEAPRKRRKPEKWAASDDWHIPRRRPAV